jgi:hypothetical protein
MPTCAKVCINEWGGKKGYFFAKLPIVSVPFQVVHAGIMIFFNYAKILYSCLAKSHNFPKSCPPLAFRPHFLDAPQHADRLEGLQPQEEKHRHLTFSFPSVTLCTIFKKVNLVIV